MYWNAVKSGLRLKLGLADPFQIKPQFRILQQEPSSIQIKFMQKKQVSSNEFVVRFALPDEDKCLGLMIGQYVELHLAGMKRPYNPISRIDEPGQVDFLVTDLRKKNGTNSFTNHLLSLQERQPVELKGPFTQFLYRGYGNLQWPGKPLRKYKHIGMIAFETGITGVYNMIDTLMPSYDSQTALSLLWVSHEPEHFLFLEEFSTLAEQQRLNCNLMLRGLKEGWVGPFGAITAHHIQSFMPPPGPDTAIMLVGGPSDIQHLKPILSNLGYDNVMLPIL